MTALGAGFVFMPAAFGCLNAAAIFAAFFIFLNYVSHYAEIEVQALLPCSKKRHCFALSSHCKTVCNFALSKIAALAQVVNGLRQHCSGKKRFNGSDAAAEAEAAVVTGLPLAISKAQLRTSCITKAKVMLSLLYPASGIDLAECMDAFFILLVEANEEALIMR